MTESRRWLDNEAALLVRRAGIALQDHRTSLERLQDLSAELSTACRKATHWNDSKVLGELWGRVVDRIEDRLRPS